MDKLPKNDLYVNSACESARYITLVLRNKFVGLFELLEKVFAKLSDKGLAQKSKNLEVDFGAAGPRGVANGPVMVIEGGEILELGDADGVEVAGYGF